jgi:thiamine biosynthesis lipoprotein
MSQNHEIRRARPLLGTIVEIAAYGASQDILHQAVNAAFAAVQKVQRLMSFHEAESDLSSLNRTAFKTSVKIDPWTYEVISFAKKLSELSNGVFDITTGSELQRWGFLPNFEQECSEKTARASFHSILLEGDNSIKFEKPLTIDLGGIAKGFAVDKAIEVLKTFAVNSSLVNAGGDMRIFGEKKEQIHIRTAQPDTYLSLLTLQNEALATSSAHLSKKYFKDREVSPLVNGVTRHAVVSDASVSVKARTCMAADALTKIIISSDENWSALFKLFEAAAFRVDQNGVHRMSSPLA